MTTSGFQTTRPQRRELARLQQRYTSELEPVPRSAWPAEVQQSKGDQRTRVWRSREFLVQEFAATLPAVARLSVSRIEVQGQRWADGIAWDELQRIKNQLGYFAHCAVEVFPPVLDEVNVANIRHLWVLSQVPAFVWSRSACKPSPHPPDKPPTSPHGL
jgi:hypothetical protein